MRPAPWSARRCWIAATDWSAASTSTTTSSTDRVAGGSGWPERRADQVVDAALALADRLGPRFFLWVHFYDPHMTYDPPAGFASAFSSRPYDGEIAFVDAQLGRLLEGLRARWGDAGLLVVVTSDHGESFGEHGDQTHSYLVYETTQRIPLLFAGPGMPGRPHRRRAGGPGGRGSDRDRAGGREAAPGDRGPRSEPAARAASRTPRRTRTSRRSPRSSTSAGARCSACAREASSTSARRGRSSTISRPTPASSAASPPSGRSWSPRWTRRSRRGCAPRPRAPRRRSR